MLRARLLDRVTDLLGGGKDNGSPVALHAGADDDRLAGSRSELARVGLEAQVEFPDLLALSVCGVRGVGIAAMRDGGHLPLGRRLAKVEPVSARFTCLALGDRLQVG